MLFLLFKVIALYYYFKIHFSTQFIIFKMSDSVVLGFVELSSYHIHYDLTLEHLLQPK